MKTETICDQKHVYGFYEFSIATIAPTTYANATPNRNIKPNLKPTLPPELYSEPNQNPNHNPKSNSFEILTLKQFWPEQISDRHTVRMTNR